MVDKKPFRVITKVPPLPAIDETESVLSLFDPDNPDLGFFNLIDDENIRLSGSKVLFYKYHQNEGAIDEVYLEDRTKPIESEGIVAWAHYDPTPLEEDLEKFGMVLKNDQIFIFNKSYIERRIGRVPHSGDIIKPDFQNQKYEIFEVQEDAFAAYGVFHLNCHARLLRDHPDTQDTVITDEYTDVGGYIGTEDII